MAAEQQNHNQEAPEAQVVEGEVLPAANEVETEAVAVATTAQPETLQQELQVVKKQAQENLEKALRAQAELDNVRKRTLRDIENAHKFALDKFAAELLPVLDSMEMGINAADSSAEQQSLKEGMALTLKMFIDVLGKFGISEVESEGQKFDPEKHEAVSMQELEGSESGAVVTVLQKGYLLNGRLLRPAMVVVAK